jgi:hypothetical protein
MNTVTEFTSKDLTNPSNRLLAMARLATPMSVILLDDEYLASAWSGALTRTLTWFSKARLFHPAYHIKHGDRNSVLIFVFAGAAILWF